MPRSARAAPPPRRRPVAGTRGRRPSQTGPPAAGPRPAPAGPVDDPVVEDPAVEERAVADPGVADRAVRAAATVKPSRLRPRPGPSAARPKTVSGVPARGAPRLLLPGLAVAAVVLTAVAAVLGWLAWSTGRTAAARDDALAAGRSHAQQILSYDYRHIDADIARAKRDITGAFGKDYADTASTVVKPTAVQYHAVVEATVKAASVVSASPSRVVVLLFVDQTTTSTRVPGPKTDQSRVRMTLVETHGTWLVSAVDAL